MPAASTQPHHSCGQSAGQADGRLGREETRQRASSSVESGASSLHSPGVPDYRQTRGSELGTAFEDC